MVLDSDMENVILTQWDGGGHSSQPRAVILESDRGFVLKTGCVPDPIALNWINSVPQL